MTPLELGGDIGGSLRGPAAFCGVYSHKPTYGLIPRRGPSTPAVPPEVSVRGPLARSVEDLVLLLNICAGPDRANVGGNAWKLDLPKPVKRSLKEYKVAVWSDDVMSPVDDALVAGAENVAGRLEKAGALVNRTARPAFDLKENHS